MEGYATSASAWSYYHDVDLKNKNIPHIYMHDAMSNADNQPKHIGIRTWWGKEKFNSYADPTESASVLPDAYFIRADGKTVYIPPTRTASPATTGVESDNIITVTESGTQRKYSCELSVYQWPAACFAVPGPFTMAYRIYRNGSGKQVVAIIHGNVAENMTATTA